MSVDIKSLTPQELTQLVRDLTAGGLSAFGRADLAEMANAVGDLAVAIENAITAPSPATVLSAEVQAADAAADEAEKAKLGQ